MVERERGEGEERKEKERSCEVEHGVVVEANPGDVVIFSSTLFHTSGFNMTEKERRVFYCNYSVNPVNWTEEAFGIARGVMGKEEGGRKRKRGEEGEEGLIREGEAPLWFAVPCCVGQREKRK